MKKTLILLFSISILFCGYAQREVEVIEKTIQNNQNNSEMTLKRKVAIGRFSNETQYAKGIFYEKENDPIGKQALDILSTKLAQSQKFILLERNDLAYLMEECRNGKNTAASIGADYIILGSVTEFGRKNIGKDGVFSSQKTQIVEAAVSIRLVDIATGQIIYSDEAKGSAEITAKTTFGIGSQAGYDATLSDKAISEAIGQLVENIINKCTDNPWKTYFISYDADGIIIAGGKNQGLKEGMIFDIKTIGKKVTNPQTGITITLPGKKVGSAKILMCGGETPETEYSFVEINSTETINENNMNNYQIEEVK